MWHVRHKHLKVSLFVVHMPSWLELCKVFLSNDNSPPQRETQFMLFHHFPTLKQYSMYFQSWKYRVPLCNTKLSLNQHLWSKETFQLSLVLYVLVAIEGPNVIGTIWRVVINREWCLQTKFLSWWRGCVQSLKD